MPSTSRLYPHPARWISRAIYRELSSQEVLMRRRASTSHYPITVGPRRQGSICVFICPQSLQSKTSQPPSPRGLFNHACCPTQRWRGLQWRRQARPHLLIVCCIVASISPLSATSACLRLQSVPALDFLGLPAQHGGTTEPVIYCCDTVS